MANRALVTGAGAICAAGRSADEIFAAVLEGRTSIAPIGASTRRDSRRISQVKWQASSCARCWPTENCSSSSAAPMSFGIYAGGACDRRCRRDNRRDALATPMKSSASMTGSAVFVGSGGGTFDSQYDYFPLMTEAHDDLHAFGEELSANVNPMWLLRSLPNNVLCHVGITHDLKGANACITHHSISGTLALVEALEALRAAKRIVRWRSATRRRSSRRTCSTTTVPACCRRDGLRAYDTSRNGSIFGEGAARDRRRNGSGGAQRGAQVLGELLGSGSASEAEGLLAISDDGDGLARAIRSRSTMRASPPATSA